MTPPMFPAQVLAHYARIWQAPVDRLRWDQGPIAALPTDFEILRFRRDPMTDVYATSGMSASGSNLELHLMARAGTFAEAGLVELLTAVAHFHLTGSRLDVGHTVNFGRAWMAGSECTHGLVSLPYLDGPELEWEAAGCERFLWLVPVTPAEVRFKAQNGLDALEERFERLGVDYLNPGRRSVA